MPDDWVEVVEAESAAGDADVGMERDDDVPAGVFPAREADVADHADQPAPGDEHAEGLAPYLFQLFENCS